MNFFKGCIMDGLNHANLKKAFEYFEATADVGFYAYGESLKEAYENAGLAMFNVISDTRKIGQNESRHIEVVSEDLVSLLYDYLEELLFLQDTEFLLFSRFDVEIYKLCERDVEVSNVELENGESVSCDLKEESSSCSYKLVCDAFGEEINWDIHPRGSEVKAITFHLMDVKKEDGIFILSAILDL